MWATGSDRSWLAVAGAVASRPALWATAVGQVFRLSPPGWWRRFPFVPKPDPVYVRFRVVTQEGGPAPGSTARPMGGPAPDAHDVVEYLAWCRAIGRAVRESRRAAVGRFVPPGRR